MNLFGGKRIVVRIEADLKDIVPGFLENRRSDICHIQKAIPEENFETIERLAHGMKGVGAGYGFHEITRIGKDMERAARDKQRKTVESLLRELVRYLDCVEVHYE